MLFIRLHMATTLTIGTPQYFSTSQFSACFTCFPCLHQAEAGLVQALNTRCTLKQLIIIMIMMMIKLADLHFGKLLSPDTSHIYNIRNYHQISYNSFRSNFKHHKYPDSQRPTSYDQ